MPFGGKTMKLAIGNDHVAVEMKNEVKAYLEQKGIAKRLLISVPIFVVTLLILFYSLSDKDGFNLIWRYFAWANQTLSVFTLWALTVWMFLTRRYYWVTMVPAVFMTCVCTTYIFIAPECFNFNASLSYIGGGVCALVSLIWFTFWALRVGINKRIKE